mmetsp:Transcript_20485/g.23378  ORF Transcript_20485/g.23378 Transcript_20485/m.23378 type:complete len:284 (+) Transcript_20485:579-1430(+)
MLYDPGMVRRYRYVPHRTNCLRMLHAPEFGLDALRPICRFRQTWQTVISQSVSAKLDKFVAYVLHLLQQSRARVFPDSNGNHVCHSRAFDAFYWRRIRQRERGHDSHDADLLLLGPISAFWKFPDYCSCIRHCIRLCLFLHGCRVGRIHLRVEYGWSARCSPCCDGTILDQRIHRLFSVLCNWNIFGHSYSCGRMGASQEFGTTRALRPLSGISSPAGDRDLSQAKKTESRRHLEVAYNGWNRWISRCYVLCFLRCAIWIFRTTFQSCPWSVCASHQNRQSSR